MTRIISIIFYSAIAFVTCMMANKTIIRRKRYSQESVSVSQYNNGSRAAAYDKMWLFSIFFILFLCSALRYDIGNDYAQYTETAHEAFVGGYVVTEFGFNWLVKIVYTLCGCEYYELVFAVFAAVTIGIFLKALYEQSENFALSFFMFMTLGLYFQTFNTVRYYLALAITVFSMRYVVDEKKKDWIKFGFFIILAAAFHKSVLIVIPAYWIASFSWKKWHIISGLVISIICFLAKGPVLKLALALYPSYKNTIYLEAGVSKSSIARVAVVVLVYIWFMWYRRKDIRQQPYYRELTFYGQLNMLALVVGMFFSFLPVVTRIMYYFNVSQILMIPLIIEHIDNERIRKTVKYLAITVCIGYFVIFLLQAHKDGVGLLPYKSILWELDRYKYS